MKESFDSALQLLRSHSKLERDKGVLSLKVAIQKSKTEGENGDFAQFEKSLISYLTTDGLNDSTWENVFGHLQASKVLVEANAGKNTVEFEENLLSCGLKYLEHIEFRVRIVAGELLGVLCKVVNVNIYTKCESVLITSIKTNLTRDIPADSVANGVKDAKEIFHDTAGWKCLETSMKSLQSIIEGCGEAFLKFVNMNLLDLIFETLNHTNRFVRETGFYLCASLARYGVSSKDGSQGDIALKLAEHLCIGLADNWSQVRLAASVATRQFFQDLEEKDKKLYFKTLLPPMCLNRYYLAEGVKLYNQESWRLILGTEGRANVALFIKEIVEFYIKQTESDNHAVREAACHCMAELSSKIEIDVVKPYVPRLLDALHFCFQDESWPVRDTACVACGNFILNFPEESKKLMPMLYPLFFENLRDPIPSVRQGASVALTNVAKVFGEESLNFIFKKVHDGFKGIKDQKVSSERYEGLDKGNATYGVIKQLRDNDMALHTNQQMYSCGSLAPKMGRSGGCMDHSFKRASEPWEAADGCIYLVSEMAHLPTARSRVQESIPLIIEAAQYKNYTHYLHVLESINKVLPNIAKGLGKTIFKRYLESFLDLVFESISSESALTKSAAVECLEFLSKFIGPNILRGRVEQHNPFHLKIFDKFVISNEM